MDSSLDSSHRSANTPIAIVGIGCMFPKAADLRGYWTTIKNKVDAITEVPETHWRPEDYYDADASVPDYTYARRGGFIDAVDFSPMDFGISPNAIDATDTTQLLSLVAAQRALEDAGYGGAAADFDRSRVGVVLGVTGTLELVIPLGARLGHPIWKRALKDAGVDPATAADVVERIAAGYVGWQENSFPGLLGNVVAGRIANRLDLGGTNCVVDAACASSLSAMHLGILELLAGRSDMIVTGGADTFNDIFMYMCFSKTPALSPTGDSRPFDHQADGTILGEGLGLMVLKRLPDAERDGDRIYAVIRSVGSSSDGKGNAVYAPDSDGQARALRDAYATAGVRPDTIELVEAHGTGTKVGDKTELNGLTKVYSEATKGSSGTGQPWCALGSVKSQIGHTKAAAGAAGLIKAALALYHKVLPPTAKVEKPLPAITEGETPFYINTEKRPWLPSVHPRRAGVSSFGFGGSNFHCVLEEYRPEKVSIDWDSNVEIFAYAAASREALQDSLKEALDALPATAPWEHARGVACTSRAKFRSDAACRLVLVVEREDIDLAATLTQARERIQANDASAWSTPDGMFFGSRPAGKLALLFPGQGAQYVGMLRDLVCQFPAFQETLAEANAAFAEAALEDGSSPNPLGLSDAIYPPTRFDDKADQHDEAALRATQVAQPAIGALSLGALRLLQEFGVHADMAAGHSYGELVALCAADRLDETSLHRLSNLRGRLMAAGDGDRGSMLAVQAPLAEIETVLREQSLDLVLANKNAPNQGVLSGSSELIEQAEKIFSARQIRCRRLPVAAAFHSPLVAGSYGPFREALEAVELGLGTLPVFSNTTAGVYPQAASESRELLASQLARPVEFVEEVLAMAQSGATTFVEVGPGRILSGLVERIVGKNEDHWSVALDASGGRRHGVYDLALTLAGLAARGHRVELERWEDGHLPQQTAPETKKKLTVPISGANTFRPANPKPARVREENAAAAVGNPAPPTAAPKLEAPRSAPPRSGPAPVTTPRPPAASTPMTTPDPLPTPDPLRPSQPSSAPAPERAAPPPNASAASQALQLTEQHLATLQQMQERAAELHRQFLETQQNAQRSFQSLVETQRSLLLGGVPGAPSVPPVELPATPVPASQVLPSTAPPSKAPSSLAPPASEAAPAARPSSESKSAPEPSRAPAVHGDAPAHPGAAAVPTPVAASTSEPASREIAPDANAAQVHEDAVEKALFAVVAEKTGYPEEVLDLGMDLDADLGIDSIKRVEILAALQEALPGITTPESDALGALQTLQDIVGLMCQNMAANGTDSQREFPAEPTADPSESPAPVAPSPDRGVSPSDAAARAEAESVLLEIVAEKTGYPTTMLELGMELDADLGIDSIKRVEILAAMQERLPAAPTLESDQLGQVQTLADVVELLTSAGAESVPTAPTSSIESRPPTPAPSSASAEAGTAATAASATPSPESVAALESLLLEIVAEKTGYPQDVLSLEMELDADLGIDSIKRVEILSAMGDRQAHIQQLDSDHMGSLQTLGDVVEALAGGAGAPATVDDAPNEPSLKSDPVERGSESADNSAATRETSQQPVIGAPAAPPTLAPAPDCVRALPVLRRDDTAGTALRLQPGAEIAIHGDGALAQCVASHLSAAGYTPRHIETLHAPNRSPAAPTQLAGLILLPPQATTTPGDLEASFRTLQRCGPALRSAAQQGDAFVLTVSRLGGDFGMSQPSESPAITDPLSGGLAALAKTARFEWPSVTCRAIDVDGSMPLEALGEAIAAECLCQGSLELGLGASGKQHVELRHRAVSPPQVSGPPIDAGDLVVVSGGARGITAATCTAIATAWRPSFLLLGRSAAPQAEPEWLRELDNEAAIKRELMRVWSARHGSVPPPKTIEEEYQRVLAEREIRATLRRLEEAGSRVRYQAVDIRSADEVRAAVAGARADFGPVRGIVHGAGVLADRLIEDKKIEQFRGVLATKIDGFNALLAALENNDDLRFLSVFSSSTARFGRKGQVDYAVANEVLNKLCQREARARPACRVVSCNWGPWEGGMVTPALARLFNDEGVSLIPIEAGARAFVDELQGGDRRAEVVFLGPDSEGLTDGPYEEESSPVTPPPIASDRTVAGHPAGAAEDLSLCFSHRLDLEGFPFLRSHVIDRRPVLPMALIAEWLAQGATQQNPGFVVHGYRNLRVLKGVVVDDAQPPSVHVYVSSATREENLYVVRAELRSVTRSGQERLNARAEVLLANSHTPPPKPRLEVVTQPYNRDRERVYSEVLFHGADFQSLEAIEGCSEAGIVARAGTAPPPSEWIKNPLRNVWLTEPLGVDSAFQLMILWSFEERGAASLPCSLKRFVQYRRTFPRDGVRLVVAVRRHSAHNAVADVEFIDNEGNLVAQIDDYECVIDSSLCDAFRRNQISQQVHP